MSRTLSRHARFAPPPKQPPGLKSAEEERFDELVAEMKGEWPGVLEEVVAEIKKNHPLSRWENALRRAIADIRADYAG